MKSVFWGLTGIMLLALYGCLSLGGTTPPSRFFVLTAPRMDPLPQQVAAGQVLLLPTVSLPAYLDRPQLVTRSGAELNIAPFERWGEPLAQGITRILAEVLQESLPQLVVTAGDNAVTGAAPLALYIDLERAEGDAQARQVVLQARWRLESSAGTIVARGTKALNEPWPGTGAEALVAAYDKVLGGFGRTLAETVAHHMPSP